jgi:polyphosphate glucokinase
MRILVIDVGGNNVKLRHPDRGDILKIPSGPALSPARMTRAVLRATADWRYDVVSIGYPGPVAEGHPARDPVNLGSGWVKFDYSHAFGRPVRIVNDAAMQALGSYEGGRMLYLGLGTGLGSALIVDNVLLPTELAHLPYRKGRTYEDYLGQRGYDRLGPRRWATHVHAVAAILQDALQVEYIVIGGGSVKRLPALPPACRAGSNANAFVGGMRLWESAVTSRPTARAAGIEGRSNGHATPGHRRPRTGPARVHPAQHPRAGRANAAHA